MGELTDLNNFEGNLRSQIEKVQALGCTADAQAITRWISGMQAKPATKIDRVTCIRKIAVAADVPLTEFTDSQQVFDTLDRFSTGSAPNVKDDGLTNGTLRQYRQAARLFFRDELDREWAEDISIGVAEPSPIGPNDILSGDEVDLLLERAPNARDKALVAFLAVTGQRITATLSIRLKDVDLGNQTGTIRLNEDALGLKGASGPRPLLWGRPYVKNWLEVHPRRNDPDAPLFCTLRGGTRGKRGGGVVEWERGDPMSRTQAARRLRKVAEEAGVDTSKVSPHTFRHTAITRMRDQGVQDDRIKWMVGVAPDSDILERYDHATDADMLDRLRDAHGVSAGDTNDVSRPTVESCQSCGAAVRATSSYCPDCGAPLTVQATSSRDGVTTSVTTDLTQLDDGEKRAVAQEALEAALDDGTILDDVLQALERHR